MNIVFSSDDNYAKYLTVTILSIINARNKVHQSYPINFYILDLGIEEKTKKYIDDIVNNYQCNTTYITVDEDEFREFPKSIGYISKSTYARLKLADYLPNIDKVLYLDVDILVMNSLLPLWETDISPAIIGACLDPFIEYMHSDYKNTIGLNRDDLYFNAGVILIDMKSWKKLNVFSKSLDILRSGIHFEYQDQDILNIIFRKNVKLLDARYNFTRNHRERIKKSIKNKITLQKYEKATMPIAIFHYVGKHKAWDSTCSISMSSLFSKLYTSLDNKPKNWNIDNVSLWQRFIRYKKDLSDKFLYKIY